jgi:hypothetical protein
MKSDYQNSLTVNANPNQVFESLTLQIPDWWTVNFKGSSSKTNDKFTVRFGKTFKTMLIEELITDKKVVWKCLDSLINISELTNKNEWNETKIIWEMIPENNGTKLDITHIGLTSDFECYKVCEKGWDFYFSESLFSFLTTNKGLPYKMSNSSIA